MFSSIRQKISDLLANPPNDSNDSKISLLEKIGGVFNFGNAAPVNSSSSQTALHRVAGQINLSNADINNQLRRENARHGFAASPSQAVQTDKGSQFWMSGGYRNIPIEVSTNAHSSQKAVLEKAYQEFGKLAGLSEAGTTEFVTERLKTNGEQVYKRGENPIAYSDTEFAAQAGKGRFAIYATDDDIAQLKATKEREENAALGAAPRLPSMSARNASTIEQITNTITDTLDATLGTESDSIGGTLNRIGVSSLHVAGDIAETIGAKESAATLHNANSGLTKQEQVTKAAIQTSGYNVPTVARIAQEAENTPEFLHDAIEGATLGDFSEKETYGAQLGKIIGGLNPIGDVRDVVANTKNAAENKAGSYVGLGASVIGAIPIAGDIAKPIIKGEKKIIAEVIEDAVKTESKEVAEQVGKAEAEKIAKEEAEKLAKAESEKAAKIEAERVAKEQAEKISARYIEIKSEGHAPARHGKDISETQLDDRSMHGKDPITGTTDDAFNKFPDGTPKPHNAGKNATKFTSEESLVKADECVRSSREYRNALNDAIANNELRFEVKDIKLEDIYGANYKDQVFGKTRLGSRNHPTGSVETDFTDGTVTAVLKKDSSGKWNVHTMYPEPKQ